MHYFQIAQNVAKVDTFQSSLLFQFVGIHTYRLNQGSAGYLGIQTWHKLCKLMLQ